MSIKSVLIDSREPAAIRALPFGGAPIVVTALEAGDVWVACDDGAATSMVIVERKTANDLLGSIADERLFDQCRRLHNLTPWAYVVVVGELMPDEKGLCWADGRSSGWNFASVQGALLTVLEMGVGVLFVPDENDFEAAVLRLAQRDRSALRCRPVRAVGVISDAEAILAAFPGVGVERARTLLTACGGSAAAAIAHLASDGPDYLPIPGIGDVTRRRARTALGLDEPGLVLDLRWDQPPAIDDYQPDGMVKVETRI